MKMTAIALFILLTATGTIYASEDVEKKAAYTMDQLRLEEAKLTKVIRGPVNAIFMLYEKNPELWYMDPLIRDRWLQNIEGLAVDGLYAARKARVLAEGLNHVSKDADKLKNLERAGEYINQLRLAHLGILKNIATMKLPLAPRVARALGLCRTEEVNDPNGLFLVLDQAEDRLQKLMEIRVSLIEHLLVSDPELFKTCPLATHIIDECADLYLDPKVKCFAELKELVTRTDMSYKSRCGAVERVSGNHKLAADAIEEKIVQLESVLPLALRISKIRDDAERKK